MGSGSWRGRQADWHACRVKLGQIQVQTNWPGNWELLAKVNFRQKESSVGKPPNSNQGIVSRLEFRPGGGGKKKKKKLAFNEVQLRQKNPVWIELVSLSQPRVRCLSSQGTSARSPPFTPAPPPLHLCPRFPSWSSS